MHQSQSCSSQNHPWHNSCPYSLRNGRSSATYTYWKANSSSFTLLGTSRGSDMVARPDQRWMHVACCQRPALLKKSVSHTAYRASGQDQHHPFSLGFGERAGRTPHRSDGWASTSARSRAERYKAGSRRWHWIWRRGMTSPKYNLMASCVMCPSFLATTSTALNYRNF